MIITKDHRDLIKLFMQLYFLVGSMKSACVCVLVCGCACVRVCVCVCVCAYTL